MQDDQKDIPTGSVTDTQGPVKGLRQITQGDPEGHGKTATSPTEITSPEVRSGAGVDIDSDRMPPDGILEVKDSDDDILEEEKRHPISDVATGSA